jgi:EAL domain-containing protein (putative c-di-GMP-specific phosphodiesterase class I)
MRPVDGRPPEVVLADHRASHRIIHLDQLLIRQAMEESMGLLGLRQLLMVNVEPETLAALAWLPWEFPLTPNVVVIEITERAPLDQLDVSVFPRVGVQLALDDFGTGTSSMLALERIKPAFVKMGREFLASHDDTGILAVMSSECSRMGMKLIVEGVEDEADLSFLHHIRARYAQGYYLGRPMFAEDYMQKRVVLPFR